MTSDVADLTTFYANLPSIFESDRLTSAESLSTASSTITDHAKTYQPMFGLFQFADSEPFTKAAFIDSPLPPEEMKTMSDQRSEENQIEQENIHQRKLSTSNEEISDIDEDDFDGIPLRHTVTMTKNMSAENSDLISHESTHPIGNNHQHNEDDNEDELFLNSFTDEEHQQLQHDSVTRPAIFQDIPDIDDLNEYEEQDDSRIPFDQMDLLDQSDSIRSSSPDSLLSSSHLLDDDEDENNEPEKDMNNDSNDQEDDVAQWNDEFLLGKPPVSNDRPNAPLPPSLLVDIHPHDQVDFIDSSRSGSRCSDTSSHLSFGYTDQARIMMNDDELETSSDSDNEDDDERINFQDETLFRSNHSDDPTLEINLDYHRSRASSSSPSVSMRSTSPYPNHSPIVDIDEVTNETATTVQLAPIAFVEDENDDDLQTSTSDQPVLSVISSRSRMDPQNELVRDIISMRHLLEEHNDDDEFLAVMHNPNVFEDILHDDDDEYHQNLQSVKQTNVDFSMIPTSFLLSDDSKNESKSLEQHQIIQQTSPLSVSNNEKNSPSNITAATTTNNRSPSTSTPVNHPLIGKENVGAISSSRIKQEKEQQWQGEKNTTSINSEQITEEKQKDDYYQMMDSDEESDNDLELLNTLAQLHGLVHTPRVAFEIDRNRLNETEIFDQQDNEEESNNIPKQVSLFKQNEKNDPFSPPDGGDGDRQKENCQNNEKKASSTLLPLTSLTSSGLYNDDQSSSANTILDSDPSSSPLMSGNKLSNSILSSNRIVTDDLQRADSKDGDLWKQSTPTLIENSSANDLRDYLYWILDHLNDDLQSAMENLQDNYPTVNSTDRHVLPDDQLEQQNITQTQKVEDNKSRSAFDIAAAPIVEKLVSNTLRLALDEDNQSNQQEEQLVDQIVSEAIYEVYNEHQPTNSTHKKSFDPFDPNFDCFWTSHFEIPDDILNQNNRPASNQGTMLPPLLSNPSYSTNTADHFTQHSVATSVRYVNNEEKSIYQDELPLDKNEPSITTDSQDTPATESQDTSKLPPTSIENENDGSSSADSDDDSNEKKQADNVFANGPRSSEFEAFASDQPLRTTGIESLAADLDDEFDDAPQIQESNPFATEQPAETNKPSGEAAADSWELEDSDEERIKPVATTVIHKNDSYNNFYVESVPATRLSQNSTSSSTADESETNEKPVEKENYDDYFATQPPVENTEQNELRLSKSVRFDENLENVNVLTPKDSLERSETASSDSDDIENEDMTPTFRTTSDRISDHIDHQEPTDEETTETAMHDITFELGSHISITESEDLPPPLPPLPPLNKKSSTSNDNLRLKSTLSPSTTTDVKRKLNGRPEPEIAASIPGATTTDAQLFNNTDAQIARSFDSDSSIDDNGCPRLAVQAVKLYIDSH